jgi:hypothetical protein
MTMTNEKDSFGAVKSETLPTAGPFIAVTRNATNPNPRASVVVNATIKKDLEKRRRVAS